MCLITYTLMREYVEEAVSNYENAKKLENFERLISAFDEVYFPEMILLKFGWTPSFAAQNHRFVSSIHHQIERYHVYYSSEYDLRIDLAFFKGTEKLCAINWFLSGTRPRMQTNVNTFTLYCILKYGGNIQAAVQNFVMQAPEKSRPLYLLKLLGLDQSPRISYTPPPAPITANHLSGQPLFELTQKLFELEKKLRQVQTASQPSVPNSTSQSTKLTSSITTNQTDGFFNQSYSQAHYASYGECRAYFNKTGIPVGHHREHPYGSPTNYKIYYQGEEHLITIAPTGSGKLTAVQIPALLEYEGSVIVVDPKGESAIISARQRQRLGQEVFIINPFEILKSEFNEIGIHAFHGFNPLQSLSVDDDNFVADVAAIAQALVLDDNSSDPYWNDSARDLISCLIMYVCLEENKENRHLPRVRELLTSDPEEFTAMMIKISNHKFKPMAQKTGRYVVEGNSSVLSIISTAMTHTLFLDDPKIAANLKRHDVDFLDLKTSQKTIYLILPAKFLLAYNRWLRLLITSALDTLMSKHNKPKKSVLFMLDEFSVLGNLPCVETAIGLARGYGIQLWLFLQDIHQLHSLYKDKAESFLANTGMQQYFVPNDLTTAERISKRMGNTTLIDERITSDTFNNGWNNLISQIPVKVDISHIERPLMYPIEVMALSRDIQIVFFAGDANPILMDKNYYYKNSNYLLENSDSKYDNNPYFKEN